MAKETNLTTPLKNISNYLKSLGKSWKPNGGGGKIKNVWDGRSFNLRHFAEYPYLAILGDLDSARNETYYYLVELDSEEQARRYYKWNQVGSGCMRILDTNTGICVSEWYAVTKFDEKDKRNKV